MKATLGALGGLLGLGVAPLALAAQTCTAAIPIGSCSANTSTTLTIGTVVQLSLSAAATPLSPPTSADYDVGFVATTGPTLTVAANRSWRLHIGAAAATWIATSVQPGVSARVTKPASDLEWSAAAGGPYVGISVAGATLATGGAGAAATTTVYYRTRYDWTQDTPGLYALTVSFTLTAP